MRGMRDKILKYDLGRVQCVICSITMPIHELILVKLVILTQ